MIIDILNSKQDIAGTNIRRAMDSLLEENGREAFPLFSGNEVTFHTTDERIINTSFSAVNPDADLVIIVSRHSSVNPVPVLTVHPAGNYGAAQLGGNDYELALCAPQWMKAVLQNHAKFVPVGYRVSYEITHHGPTSYPIPSFFVEVGSTEKEWNDEKAYTAAAKSVLYAKPDEEAIPLIGFGGTHYAVRQSAIAENTKGAFGHMMHSRDVKNVTKEIILQMSAKSGGISAAHIDRKAMTKEEVSRISVILEELEIPEITEGELEKINHMSYASWKKYTKFAGEIDNRMKIHPHGEISDGTPAKIELPAELITLAFGKDDSVLMSCLDDLGDVFHTTGKNGELMPIFLCEEKKREKISVALIASAVQYITRTQETVMEGSRLTVMYRKFDPGLARTLGVPSGPLFGKLASGKAVILADGREILPEMVTAVTKTTINIPGKEK